MSSKTKVRFAPSPTGAPHVGNIRTALFAWLFARNQKGSFVLRIEDTDQSRKQEGSLESILESLLWLGLDIDEGVYGKKEESGEIKIAEKGDCGPYFQSKRLSVYKEHAQKLIDSGHAYYCFCSEDRLNSLREEQEKNKKPPKYDGLCLKLTEEEIKKKLESGQSCVIRMKVPEDGSTVFEDIVKGKISFENHGIDHQVLIKSDGFPTYHLASVVDDHLMGITHVIRADEWLPSTPKHILLYKYFEWQEPLWVHLPIILGKDKSKLSKRHGAVSVIEYKKDYLPEALLNYLALLGWNPKTNQEIFSREELIESFDLKKINKNNPIFDIEKLNWFNNQYIKNEKEDILEQAIGDGIKKYETKIRRKAINLAKERMEKLSDFFELTGFLLEEKFSFDTKILIPKNSNQETAISMLNKSLDIIKNCSEKDFNIEGLRKIFFDYCEANNIQKGDILWPLRVSVTGLKNSPDVFEVIDALGKEKTILRIKDAIQSFDCIKQ